MVRSAVALMILASCAAYSDDGAVTQPGSGRGKAEAKEVHLSSQQTTRLQDFLQAASNNTSILRTTADWEPNFARPPAVRGVTKWVKVDQGVEGEKCRVQIDDQDGTVYAFSREGPEEEPGVRGKTHADAISEEAAFQAAVPILKYYNMPISRKEYRFRLEDFAEMDDNPTEDDLDGCTWQVRREFRYHGLPCRGRSIVIWVSAYSGKVQVVSYLPIIVPREPAKKITRAEALESAKGWVGQNPHLADRAVTFDDDAEKRIEEVVATPNDVYVPKELRPQRSDSILESFHCWEVPFKYTQDGYTVAACLRVNVENGQVIGGGPQAVDPVKNE